MSLLNVWVEPERILIGVDTAAMFISVGGTPKAANGAAAGTRFECSKMLPIVHLNAILAGRGSGWLLPHLLTASYVRPWAGLDQLFDDMPRLLSAARIKTLIPLIHPRHEILLAGWSERLGRMRAVMYVQQRRLVGFVPNEVEEIWIGPWEDDVQGAPVEPDSRQTMAELMRAQLADARVRFPNMAVGGRALVAEVTREQMRVEELCGLDVVERPAASPH